MRKPEQQVIGLAFPMVRMKRNSGCTQQAAESIWQHLAKGRRLRFR